MFRTRRLDHLAFPYVFVDATYIKARIEHHIVSRAVVVATGVAADGNREVLGLDIGDSEYEVFWTQFLRSLRDRGLAGVKLVIFDAHSGLKAAIGRVFQGSTWQRCRVHLMRNLLTHVPKGHKEMIAATVRTIFAQPDPETTRDQLRQVVGMLEIRYPNAAELLSDERPPLRRACRVPTWSRRNGHSVRRLGYRNRSQTPTSSLRSFASSPTRQIVVSEEDATETRSASSSITDAAPRSMDVSLVADAAAPGDRTIEAATALILAEFPGSEIMADA